MLGLSLAVLTEGAADIHLLVKPTFFVPAHMPLISPGIEQFALAHYHGCELQLSLFEIRTAEHEAQFLAEQPSDPLGAARERRLARIQR